MDSRGRALSFYSLCPAGAEEKNTGFPPSHTWLGGNDGKKDLRSFFPRIGKKGKILFPMPRRGRGKKHANRKDVFPSAPQGQRKKTRGGQNVFPSAPQGQRKQTHGGPRHSGSPRVFFDPFMRRKKTPESEIACKAPLFFKNIFYRNKLKFFFADYHKITRVSSTC